MEFSGHDTIWAFEPWAFTPDHNIRPRDGYLIFRAVGDNQIDYGQPVTMAAAGSGSITLTATSFPHAADTDYSYAVRACSASGMIDTGSDCNVDFTINAAGTDLAYPAPAAVLPNMIRLTATAGGKFKLQIISYTNNTAARAFGIEICNANDIDWASPLAEGNLQAAISGGISIDTAYTHNSPQRFAVRAISNRNAASEVSFSGYCYADAVGPAAATVLGVSYE